jgi:very-short-patch-repair endonuclease
VLLHAERIDAAVRAVLAFGRFADVEAFFADPSSPEDNPEPFFVKNLERVQGDERDAIILSVGYGNGGGGETDSFTADVAARLAEMGIAVVPQYGVGGYRVDFAAAHPDDPSRMILAVEADGVAYRDSGSIRDRDRLRKEHLERLGWRVHRLWSTSWLADPERELARLRVAYESAVAASPPAQSPPETPETPETPEPFEPLEPRESPDPPEQPQPQPPLAPRARASVPSAALPLALPASPSGQPPHALPAGSKAP